jgi:hypothetical protein
MARFRWRKYGLKIKMASKYVICSQNFYKPLNLKPRGADETAVLQCFKLFVGFPNPLGLNPMG